MKQNNQADESDYSSIDQCYEIDRDSLEFVEKLGSGQFGDVYRGTFTKKVCLFFESSCVHVGPKLSLTFLFHIKGKRKCLRGH